MIYHHPDDSQVPWRDFTEYIPSPGVSTLYTDPSGDVWVGTVRDDEHPAGMVWIDVGGTIHNTWTVNNPFSERLDNIQAFVDINNHLWVGTWNDGLWRLVGRGQAEEWRMMDSGDDALQGNVLSMVAHPDGTVWFGTWYSGLWGYHPDKGWW